MQRSWPALAEPYLAALQEAVDDVLANVDAVGVLATGTIVRGNPDPSSDLDVYVVHEAARRRRWQKFYQGVPTEVFVNPPEAIRTYFAEEHRDGRPLTAHMLATGHVVVARGTVLDELRTEAAEWLARTVELSTEAAVRNRYGPATLYEDALDVLDADPATGLMLLGQAVRGMIEYRFLSAGRFIPRPKEMLKELAVLNPRLGELARAFFTGATVEKVRAAAGIADLTIAARGFFEWDSGWETVSE